MIKKFWNFIFVLVLLSSGVALASISGNGIQTTVIPSKTKVYWESPQFTVESGNNLIMAIRDSQGNILDFKQLGPVANKDFTGYLTLVGDLE